MIAAAGDIACQPGMKPTATSCQQAATGQLLNSINPSVVLPLGDTQYESGSAAEYAGSYNVVQWGADKTISRPASGNHEYNTPNAADFFNYFGANAGDPSKGYYSYNIAGPGNAFHWHVIVLNSECTQAIVGGCGVGSPQETWLKSDLAANPGTCTLAYWHRPRFSSSSTTPSSTTYVPFWTDLYNAGADVILNGHAHDYERFSPQTPTGASDPAKGITEFVVGTGGDNFQVMGPAIANSVVRENTSFGVMKMTLHASSYDYQFIPATGYSFTDSGSGTCHNAPAVDTTPPSQPTGLTASAPSPSQANLSWTASTDNVGVTGYNIYRGANGSTPTLLATTTTSAASYTDTSVLASTAYTYQVQAFDAAGNKSALSATALVTVPATADTTPPTPPANLAPEDVSYNELDLGWQASTDTGTGVSGYRVYRRVTGTTAWTLMGTTDQNTTNYQDTSVVQNTTYDYEVTAFDGAGNISLPSNIATVTAPAGPTSTNYTFNSAGDATIDQTNPTKNAGTAATLVADNSPVNDFLLKFNLNAPNCQTISGATLRLSDDADGSAKGGDIYTTGSGWTESTVTWSNAPGRGVLLNSLGAVSSGGTYTIDVTKGVVSSSGEVDFRVASTSSDGVKYFSKEGAGTNSGLTPQLSVTCATGPSDTQAPTAPANLAAVSPNSGEVDLSWTASTDNVGVTGYNIYRGGAKVASVSGSASSYSDLIVSPATSYSYQVTAVDAAGNESVKSNTATITTAASVQGPAAPTNLSASATSSNEVDLTWTPSTTTGVTGYNIYRGPHGGTLVKVNSTAGPGSYADTTATPGTAYDYQVTAVDSTGLESARTAIATATTPSGSDTQPPTAPSGLKATAAGSGEIDLSWTASTDNVGVTSYTVSRAPTGTTTFATVGTTTTATTFQDVTVSPSTGYDYQVKASDAAGNISPPSNTATATTPAGAGGGIAPRSPAAVTKVTTGSTSWTVNLPAYSAGDFAVIWLGNNLGSTAGTPSSPGWTTQLSVNESSGLKGSFLTRRMAGTEGTAIPVTWTGSSTGVAEAVAFSGVNATTPVDAKAGQLEASTTAISAHSTPSVTVPAGDVLVSGFTTDVLATWTPPAGDTEILDAATSTGGPSSALYYSGPVAAGNYSKTATASAASVKAVSAILVLRPA